MGDVQVVPTLAERLEATKADYERDLGSAAAHIVKFKRERLYKATHATWEAFCGEYLKMSARRADQIIAAAEIGTMVPIPDAPTPANERQARALAPLKNDPEAISEVMDKVTAAPEPVTAATIADAVAEKLQQVEDVTAELDAAKQEVGRLNAMAPNDFDPVLNSRLIGERGQLVRVCDELLGLGDPADFFERQSAHLRDSHTEAVSKAATWLARLNKVMEDR
jgi:hypothetical protein